MLVLTRIATNLSVLAIKNNRHRIRTRVKPFRTCPHQSQCTDKSPHYFRTLGGDMYLRRVGVTVGIQSSKVSPTPKGGYKPFFAGVNYEADASIHRQHGCAVGNTKRRCSKAMEVVIVSAQNIFACCNRCPISVYPGGTYREEMAPIPQR
jgi:hypothetical protein